MEVHVIGLPHSEKQFLGQICARFFGEICETLHFRRSALLTDQKRTNQTNQVGPRALTKLSGAI